MSFSDAVDDAIIAALTDATLAALMPGGVYFNVSPTASQFVIVELELHADEYQFNGTAFERFAYVVTAVEKAAADVNGRAAARRIHELLHDVPLVIDGYAHTLTRRLSYVQFQALDEVDRANRWQHRGGRYEVLVTPVDAVVGARSRSAEREAHAHSR